MYKTPYHCYIWSFEKWTKKAVIYVIKCRKDHKNSVMVVMVCDRQFVCQQTEKFQKLLIKHDLKGLSCFS